jgi:flagellar biosynthesis protein FliQ
VPFLPESLRGRAESVEADPFRYLRGVLAFLVGGGAVVALILGLTGISPRALILAGLLWTLLGVLSGLVDWLLEPMIDFTVKVLSNVGLVRAGGGFSAEETLAAQGHTEAAAEAYRLRAQVPKDRVAALLRRAELMAGPLQLPHAAVGELEELQQEADRLRPIEDMRLGLVLAELYEQRLNDPGRAMVEIRRLIDRYPQARQTCELRGLLAALRRQHFPPPVT